MFGESVILFRIILFWDFLHDLYTKKINFSKTFYSGLNTIQWSKSRSPMILNVIYYYQNAVGLLLLYLKKKELIMTGT